MANTPPTIQDVDQAHIALGDVTRAYLVSKGWVSICTPPDFVFRWQKMLVPHVFHQLTTEDAISIERALEEERLDQEDQLEPDNES